MNEEQKATMAAMGKAALTGSDFGFDWSRYNPLILDEDGETVALLAPPEYLALVDGLNQEQLGMILRAIGSIAREARERGFNAGRRAGIEALHDVLGINKLAAVIRGS